MNEVAEIPVEEPRELSRNSAPAGRRIRRFHASTLFGEAREVLIEHSGEEYRLRITHAGKLILTK